MITTETIVLSTLEKTRRFGNIIGSLCVPGDVVGLGGDLGAGKTTLAQAIAAGAGVDPSEYVCSPSFALLHEYRGRIPVYHMDFYRLHSSEDVLAMGLDEYLSQSGLALVEWYDKAVSVLPDQSLLLRLAVTGEQSREVVLHSHGSAWQQRIILLVKRLANP